VLVLAILSPTASREVGLFLLRDSMAGQLVAEPLAQAHEMFGFAGHGERLPAALGVTAPSSARQEDGSG
jgi:hypothetical protein